jgi:hypothetical protein
MRRYYWNGSLGNGVESFGEDAFGSGYGPVASSCEHGNETPGSIKGGAFFK